MKLTIEFPDVAARIEESLITVGRDDIAAQISEVEVVRWTFDSDVYASYIYVQSPREINVVETNVIGVKHGETVTFERDDSSAVDLDNFGRLTGIELLNYRVVPATKNTDKPWWKFW